jgi:tRNA dimethylallyltransferase
MGYFELAIIGATASGKSSLAIEIAEVFDGEVLSLDSLSIYKEIDIASAKPSKIELQRVPHHGIDIIYPDEYFSVVKFANLYKNISQKLQKSSKPLIITGGSSFYLKTLLDGLSPTPQIDNSIKRKVKEYLKYPDKAYNFLQKVDKNINIKPNDTYRLEKALEIFLATDQPPTLYFKQNPPKPIIQEIPIFEIVWEREELRKRITKRTQQMVKMGLVDEVAELESKYKNRTLTPLKAIGIKEVLDYFDGRVSKEQMREKIITNTARLAKRQNTFNRSQFEKNIKRASLSQMKDEIFLQVQKISED